MDKCIVSNQKQPSCKKNCAAPVVKKGMKSKVLAKKWL